MHTAKKLRARLHALRIAAMFPELAKSRPSLESGILKIYYNSIRCPMSCTQSPFHRKLTMYIDDHKTDISHVYYIALKKINYHNRSNPAMLGNGPRCLNRASPPRKLVTIGVHRMTTVNGKGAFTFPLSVRPPGLSEMEGWLSRTQSFQGVFIVCQATATDISVHAREVAGNKCWDDLCYQR